MRLKGGRQNFGITKRWSKHWPAGDGNYLILRKKRGNVVLNGSIQVCNITIIIGHFFPGHWNLLVSGLRHLNNKNMTVPDFRMDMAHIVVTTGLDTFWNRQLVNAIITGV